MPAPHAPRPCVCRPRAAGARAHARVEVLTRRGLPCVQRIDCVHEARRGWYDQGVHVLDDDGLSIDDLAPSEVKSRIMTYCESPQPCFPSALRPTCSLARAVTALLPGACKPPRLDPLAIQRNRARPLPLPSRPAMPPPHPQPRVHPACAAVP